MSGQSTPSSLGRAKCYLAALAALGPPRLFIHWFIVLTGRDYGVGKVRQIDIIYDPVWKFRNSWDVFKDGYKILVLSLQIFSSIITKVLTQHIWFKLTCKSVEFSFSQALLVHAITWVPLEWVQSRKKGSYLSVARIYVAPDLLKKRCNQMYSQRSIPDICHKSHKWDM